MESGWGYARFFLQDAPKRTRAVIEFAGKRFPDLFNGVQKHKRNTPSGGYRRIVGGVINDRYSQLCALGNYEPGRIAELERCPIIDYYMILNSRVQEAEKANKNNKK